MSDHLFDVMPVITLWQPWAQWVMLGWKKIETRTHDRFKSLAGQRIGIHVGQKWDAYALAEAQHYLGQQQRDATGNWPDLVGAPGCIIATAFVKEHRLLGASDAKAALIECGTRRWGLVLTDLRMVPFIKAPGKQGIWYHKRPEVA